MKDLRKILHVEDESDILSVSQIALETLHGFDVRVCQDATQAISACLDFRPDLLLLDVMMPEKNGLELLRELREFPELKDIPVIFMTAKVQSDELEKFLSAGAIAVIPKPFDPVTLGDCIREHWVHHQSITPDTSIFS